MLGAVFAGAFAFNLCASYRLPYIWTQLAETKT